MHIIVITTIHAEQILLLMFIRPLRNMLTSKKPKKRNDFLSEIILENCWNRLRLVTITKRIYFKMFLLLIWFCFYQLTVFLFKCENTFKTSFIQYICLLCFIPAASRQQQKFKSFTQVSVLKYKFEVFLLFSSYIILLLYNILERHNVLCTALHTPLYASCNIQYTDIRFRTVWAVVFVWWCFLFQVNEYGGSEFNKWRTDQQLPQTMKGLLWCHIIK